LLILSWLRCRDVLLRRVEQVGPPLLSSLLALLAPPLGDRLMVAAEQHVGHGVPAVLARPGVLGKLEPAVLLGERVVLAALLVSQHVGDQANDAVDHRHRRHLAAVEHIVSDGNLRGLQDVGDPLADLGYTLIYWIEAGEGSDVEGTSITTGPGFFTRDEIVAAYAKASGRDVSAIDYYQVLALYKLAVIAEGIYARFLKGQTLGEKFAGMKRTTRHTAARALAIADRSSDPRLRGAAA